MSGGRPWAGRKIHFVGIGGAGMSGWARVAVQLGAEVSGSDRDQSPALDRLRALGIAVTVGHDAANVPEGADIFHSTAIPDDNPERTIGGRTSKPRAELLRELTTMAKVIAIAGAHGKTTTSSMAAHALLGAGLEPGYLIGGALTTTGENADWGAGEWLVVEADESDRSMLALETDVAVVLNIELDHHTTYGSLRELERVFDEFRAAAPVRVVAPELAREGDLVFDPGAVTITQGGSRFSWRGHDVVLSVPGEHNARNAAAALEACRQTGADEAALVSALASFRGAGRRFQRLGTTASGAVVVDDYAHHPTEVAATIAAGRSLGAPRIVAWFQPHLYSRTAQLGRRFGEALAAADLVVVSDVYRARERPEDFPGVSGLTIAEAAADAGARAVVWMPGLDQAAAHLGSALRAGDLLLAMGAGDIDTAAHRLLAGAAVR
ncbi:MAG: Mur ligase domain-containing protein [Baekduia sp.]